MKLLLIQPGRYGDIIICLPIAKYYADLGYKVYWPVPEEYCSLFKSIDYVVPVGLPYSEFNIIRPIYQFQANNSFDKVVDLSFGFGGKLDAWWAENGPRFGSFVNAKYQLAAVPVESRWNLDWRRSLADERKLSGEVAGSDKYTLVHNTTHVGTLFDTVDARKIVYFKPQGSFNIFDWYGVILGAEEIHCIDSVLANFIETIVDARDIKKYIYLSKRNPGMEYLNSIYRNNWIEV